MLLSRDVALSDALCQVVKVVVRASGLILTKGILRVLVDLDVEFALQISLSLVFLLIFL